MSVPADSLQNDIRGGEKWSYSHFLFPERHIPLHVMPVSFGFETRRERSYRFHGLDRGGAEFAIFQYTVAGEGVLSYEGKDYRLGPGDAFLIHIPHDHCYYFDPDSGPGFWTHCFFTVNGREALRLLRSLEAEYGPVLHLKPDSAPILKLLNAIRKLRAGKFPKTAFAASALAYKLVMSLCSEVSVHHAEGRSEPNFIRTAQTYCLTHLADDVTLDDIAAATGYSKYHFSRLFREACGLTPARFLQDLRLKAALRQLQFDTDRTIKELSTQCGFFDESYFCRCFKRKFGCSPQQFRYTGRRPKDAPLSEI